MANSGLLSIRIENSPSPPESGNGEVAVQIGRKELTLYWRDGEITDVRDASGSSDGIIDLSLAGGTVPVAVSLAASDDPIIEEAIRCYKCWVDEETGAYICLPTAC
jgi:hypothetical protein